jgi:hypothetical protein
MFSLLGGLVLLVVGIVLIVCNIWILVECFSESILWGVLSLFFPIVMWIFVIMHWDRTKTPALLTLLSIPLMLVGSFIMGMG